MPAERVQKFVRFAWVTLAITVVVIVWGAVVRATGSGAGCGSHWPLCNGDVVPLAPTTSTIIEFTHRLTSGLALVLSSSCSCGPAACFRGASRAHVGGSRARVHAGEAAIGAGIVLLELVENNARRFAPSIRACI
jgi:heme A synthase